MFNSLTLESELYPGNCPPTPPLTQLKSIDNKLGLMLGWGGGGGGWTVAQTLMLILVSFYFLYNIIPGLHSKGTKIKEMITN